MKPPQAIKSDRSDIYVSYDLYRTQTVSIRHRISVWFVRGGYVDQDTSNLFANAGNNGYYWSSTPNSNGTNAYSLNLNGSSNINPSNSINRSGTASVRCLRRARSPFFEIIMLLSVGGCYNGRIGINPYGNRHQALSLWLRRGGVLFSGDRGASSSDNK